MRSVTVLPTTLLRYSQRLMRLRNVMVWCKSPPGNYLTGKLKVGKGVAIEGHSAWSFRSYGDSIFTLNTADGDCLLDITGAFGCSIRGMSLNGQGIGEGIHGVKLCWERHNRGSEEDTPTIDDCRIGNFSGNAVHLENVWCFSVRHSMLCFSSAGLYIEGSDGFIMDNWFSGNRDGGMKGGRCCVSVTATGNRVEWNRLAGFYLPNVNCCNFTGNYFDRSGGPALVIGTDHGHADTISVTGNLIYRSGKPKSIPFDEEYDSSHFRITNADNIVFIGNTLRIGCDDGSAGAWSPNYCIVIKNCKQCIIRDNVWNHGSVEYGIVLLGDNHDVAVDGNIGCTYNPANAT